VLTTDTGETYAFSKIIKYRVEAFMQYFTVKDTCRTELTIKKSRFICILHPLDQVTAFDSKMEQIKNQYKGANHYCFAYRVRQKGVVSERCSDDGEPSGTAGAPILNVLKQNGLENILAVVIRYFGGTLLGTGGLIRAYTGSVQAALNEVNRIAMEFARELKITLDYTYYHKFEQFLQAVGGCMGEVVYADRIVLNIFIAVDLMSNFLAAVDDLSLGTAAVEVLDQRYIPSELLRPC
jgi:uncharacterized YigZ family protein